jgi:hypothetical protein
MRAIAGSDDDPYDIDLLSGDDILPPALEAAVNAAVVKVPSIVWPPKTVLLPPPTPPVGEVFL